MLSHWALILHQLFVIFLKGPWNQALFFFSTQADDGQMLALHLSKVTKEPAEQNLHVIESFFTCWDFQLKMVMTSSLAESKLEILTLDYCRDDNSKDFVKLAVETNGWFHTRMRNGLSDLQFTTNKFHKSSIREMPSQFDIQAWKLDDFHGNIIIF